MFDYSAQMAVATITTTNLADLAERGVLSGVVARERTLPVLPAFEPLLPGAVLQRGSVVACEGSAAATLALALAAGPAQAGAWVAVAGFPAQEFQHPGMTAFDLCLLRPAMIGREIAAAERSRHV